MLRTLIAKHFQTSDKWLAQRDTHLNIAKARTARERATTHFLQQKEGDLRPYLVLLRCDTTGKEMQ